jgi:hypothetical protein
VCAHAFSASARPKIEAKGGVRSRAKPGRGQRRPAVPRRTPMLAAIANTFSNCFKIPELKSRIIFT